MLPPISTLIGGVSLINHQAHKGPNTASVNTKTPTTAEGVVFDPIVIKINPNPIWKKPANKAKKRSCKAIDKLPAIRQPIIAEKTPAINWAGTISTVGYFLIIITNITKEAGVKKATIFPINCSLDWMDKELPSINKTPDIPKIIEKKVIKLIFSFKKKYPNTAKKMVSVVIIKFVFATVVLYIENT